MNGGELAQEGEVPSAAGAGEGLWFGEVWNRIKLGSEVEADDAVGFDGRSTGKAVVSHPCKTFGQNMDEPAAYELGHCQCHDPGFA